MPSSRNIYVAGHLGMVGSAIVRRLRAMDGHTNIIAASHEQLDLTRQADVETFFKAHQIDEVYLAAGKVGGIYANDAYPAQFIYENMMIEANIIHSAHESDVQKLMFLGSSCIYPKFADQPMKEESLLTGILEPTNEPYAIAKIAGIKLCEAYHRQYGRDYRSVMPTNLYGPGDNFHPQNSHVIPGLMVRFHNAAQNGDEEVVVWGTGTPRREFLHVDDMAAASIYVMELDEETYQANTTPTYPHVNVGAGVDYTIAELAEGLAKVTGFKGKISFDSTRPDGTPRKLMDVSRLADLGWKAGIDLETGLADAYSWYLNNAESRRD